MIITKIKIDIIDKIITPNLHIKTTILIITLNPHIEITQDKDLDQDHKHQIQTFKDTIIHIDHLQDQDLIITDQDHHSFTKQNPQRINKIEHKEKPNTKIQILNLICIIQQKQQMQ